MSAQAEFLKNVRENLNNVQQKATARLESLNGNARKIFTDVVEKGKASQKDLSDRLSKLASPEGFQQKVKPVAETALKRVTEASEKARSYVNHASREQVSAFAGSLRKVAARLDEIGNKPEAPNTQTAAQ